MSAATVKLGRDLVVGDVLVGLLCGPGKRITRFEDYPADSPLHERQGGPLSDGTRIAYSGEWGITVPPLSAFEVAR